jgi:polysaccharide pyruvyl transferase WcaK-like protein
MNKRNMKILLCGLLVTNGNLGCVALTYSAISVLQVVSNKLGLTFHYKIVGNKIDDSSINTLCQQLNIDRKLVEGEEINSIYNNKCERQKFLNLVRNWADVAVDATQGDSFADIYGWRRFLNFTYAKILIEKNGVPLLLAPQTYGPYNKLWTKKLAKYACKKASLVMSRDEISKNVLVEMGVKKPIVVVSDMAFFLPYNEPPKDTSVTKFGINVSGLLWNGGYTKDNQFGLSVDYQKTIRTIIEKIKSNPNNKLYLIGHVISSKDNSVEDDYAVCKKLAEEYDIELAPRFSTPIEAKSFISGLDIFMGSRMHATIASYSSGVATIPLAYSRKFVGLFNNLNYPYVLDLCNTTEDVLLQNLDKYINEYKSLLDNIENSKMLLEEKKNIFVEEITKWVEANYERKNKYL